MMRKKVDKEKEGTKTKKATDSKLRNFPKALTAFSLFVALTASVALGTDTSSTPTALIINNNNANEQADNPLNVFSKDDEANANTAGLDLGEDFNESVGASDDTIWEIGAIERASNNGRATNPATGGAGGTPGAGAWFHYCDRGTYYTATGDSYRNSFPCNAENANKTGRNQTPYRWWSAISGQNPTNTGIRSAYSSFFYNAFSQVHATQSQGEAAVTRSAQMHGMNGRFHLEQCRQSSNIAWVTTGVAYWDDRLTRQTYSMDGKGFTPGIYWGHADSNGRVRVIEGHTPTNDFNNNRYNYNYGLYNDPGVDRIARARGISTSEVGHGTMPTSAPMADLGGSLRDRAWSSHEFNRWTSWDRNTGGNQGSAAGANLWDGPHYAGLTYRTNWRNDHGGWAVLMCGRPNPAVVTNVERCDHAQSLSDQVVSQPITPITSVSHRRASVSNGNTFNTGRYNFTPQTAVTQRTEFGRIMDEVDSGQWSSRTNAQLRTAINAAIAADAQTNASIELTTANRNWLAEGAVMNVATAERRGSIEATAETQERHQVRSFDCGLSYNYTDRNGTDTSRTVWFIDGWGNNTTRNRERAQLANPNSGYSVNVTTVANNRHAFFRTLDRLDSGRNQVLTNNQAWSDAGNANPQTEMGSVIRSYRYWNRNTGRESSIQQRSGGTASSAGTVGWGSSDFEGTGWRTVTGDRNPSQSAATAHTSYLPDSAHQVLSVRCNQNAFNTVMNNTAGETIVNNAANDRRYAAVAVSRSFNEIPNSPDWGGGSGNASQQRSFYTRECPLQDSNTTPSHSGTSSTGTLTRFGPGSSNSNSFAIISNNESARLRFDVPQPSTSSVSLSSFANNGNPIYTLVTRNANGTPSFRANSEGGLARMEDEDGRALFAGNSSGSLNLRNDAVPNAFSNATIELMRGDVRDFTIRSNWAGDSTRPHFINVAYGFEANVRTQLPRTFTPGATGTARYGTNTNITLPVGGRYQVDMGGSRVFNSDSHIYSTSGDGVPYTSSVDNHRTGEQNLVVEFIRNTRGR